MPESQSFLAIVKELNTRYPDIVQMHEDITAAQNNVSTDAQTASDKADVATTAAASATTSKNAAKTSEDNAKQSETNAGLSSQSAGVSASTALGASQTATGAAASATTSKNAAKTSEDNAKQSEINAAASATLATQKTTDSINARNSAIAAAALAQTIKDSIWNINVPIKWVSGSTYEATNLVIDPSTLKTYIVNKDIVNSTVLPHIDDANFDIYTIAMANVNGNIVTVQMRANTEANLAGTVLALGEMAAPIDKQGQAKIGDGITAYENLPYVGQGVVRFDDLLSIPPAVAAIAALSLSADKLPYATGANTIALADFTAFARSILSAADATTAQDTLGVTALFDALKAGSTKTLADIETLIANIWTVLASNDVNLDSFQEIVNYIKSEQTLIDSITVNKVNVADIVNVLTSTATNKPLSAAQGKVLKDAIDAIHTHNNKAVLDNFSDTGGNAYYGAKQLAGVNVSQTFTMPQRGSVTTANTLAIELSLGNFFKATLGAAATLSFASITEGQTGEIFLDNSGGYTISKGANILCDTSILASISTAGKYRLSYACFGTSVVVTASKALS